MNISSPLAPTLALLILASPAATSVARAQGSAAPRALVRQVLAPYESIRAALATDSTDGVARHARRIQAIVRGGGAEATRSLGALSRAAGRVAGASDIAAARAAFGALSTALIRLLEADPQLRRGLHRFQCPMAHESWVQPSAQLQNPYMGTQMATCGGPVSW